MHIAYVYTHIYIYTHIVYVYNQLYNYICTRVNVNPPSLGSLKELVEKYKVFVRSRRFIVSLSLAAMRSPCRIMLRMSPWRWFMSLLVG